MRRSSRAPNNRRAKPSAAKTGVESAGAAWAALVAPEGGVVLREPAWMKTVFLEAQMQKSVSNGSLILLSLASYCLRLPRVFLFGLPSTA